MSESDNPYKAPEADLIPPGDPAGGSIESTLEGRADLDFAAVMSEAWSLVSGFKAIVIIASIIMVVIAGVLTGLLNLIFNESITQLLVTVLLYPILAGLFMAGLRRSVDLPVEYSEPFNYYEQFLPIAAVGILQSLLTGVGFVLLILPGIYLSIALSLAIPLCVEKNMGVIDSLMTSLKIINAKFLVVTLLAIVTALVLSLSAMTVIGLIWAAPWGVLVFAITYRQLAGTELSD